MIPDNGYFDNFVKKVFFNDQINTNFFWAYKEL